MKKIFLAAFFCFQCINLTGHEGTVVGIHGIMATSKSLVPLQKALTCVGFDVQLYDFSSRDKTIQDYGCRLTQRLQKIAEQKPGEPIHFVTHSMGALVLRNALNNPCCPNEAKIGRAVLLAPPNKGSKLARSFKGFLPLEWALGQKMGWQLMTFDEDSITYCLGNYPDTMQIYVIAGSRGTHLWFHGEPNDGFLTVDETKLNTPHYFCILPIDHGNLLSAPVSLELTRNFLLGFSTQECQY